MREQAWQELQETRADPTEPGLPRLVVKPSSSASAKGLEDEHRLLLAAALSQNEDEHRLLLAERARTDLQQRELDELRAREALVLGLRAEVRRARATAAADGAMRDVAERRMEAAEKELAAALRDARESRQEVEEHALLLRQLRSSARAMAMVAERAKRAERESREADGLQPQDGGGGGGGGLPGVEEEERVEARAGIEAGVVREAAVGQHRGSLKLLIAPLPLDEATMLEATLFSPTGGGGGSAGLVDHDAGLVKRDLASLRADMLGFQRLRARSVGGAPPPPLLLAAMDAVASAGEDAFASFLTGEYARLVAERGGVGLARLQ